MPCRMRHQAAHATLLGGSCKSNNSAETKQNKTKAKQETKMQQLLKLYKKKARRMCSWTVIKIWRYVLRITLAPPPTPTQRSPCTPLHWAYPDPVFTAAE